MAFNLTISIDEEHKKFIDEKQLSPSALIRDKINEIIKEKDPELYQAKIDKFEKGSNTNESIWVKLLNEEGDHEKRKLIVLDHLNSLGINITGWNLNLTNGKETSNPETSP